ncbi:LysR family transcriptional regulator [Cohnella abietis]|uniref:Putative HTH-type transcriptional regulator YybE n=1 Tax=Cohnella abietis TaxID=2507935 RepID=A0A3T1D3Q9_9BACL|nr:LysR family transcriptional regulator [Cohnella abietis]BBI32743.1 putative HTH-type transcriptional regulator YybE [Cohnella abietis]
MELNQMEYFLTVAKLQHVTRAAEALSITQPAISHSIAKLEEELRMPLFERSGRNLRLNACGEMFALRVERVLHEIKMGKQELEAFTNPDTGVVSIAFLNILGTRLIPWFIRSFREQYPNVRFDLQQGNGAFIRNQLDSGKSDLCISLPRWEEQGNIWTPVCSYRLDLAVPSNHHWVGRERLGLDELGDEPYIGLKSQCGLKSILDALFDKRGIVPNITYEAEDLPTVSGFVSAGLGVSLLPRASSLETEGISWIAVDIEEDKMPVEMGWKEKRHLSPATLLFRDFLIAKKYLPA